MEGKEEKTARDRKAYLNVLQKDAARSAAATTAEGRGGGKTNEKATCGMCLAQLTKRISFLKGKSKSGA